MKPWFTLALLASFSLPNVSFANVYGMPGYGLPENRGDAYQVCESLNYSSDRASCISVVRGNYFDRGALETCRQINFSSDKLNCLRTIANQRYDQEVLNVCSSLTYSSDKISCLTKVAGHVYNRAALEACQRNTYSSDKTSCLDSIADQLFNSDAVGICSSLTFSSDRSNCLQKIANLDFDAGALRVCAGITYASDKISCLERAGYPMVDRRDYGTVRPLPMPRQNSGDTWGQILLDAIDLALRDILVEELNANRGSDLCSVENSSGRVLGQVRASRLEIAGSRFAREQSSCVVTNISGVARTRTLISPNGSVLGSRMTENETAQLKNRMGFDRCRVLTCRM